jgi:hypothetical protein
VLSSKASAILVGLPKAKQKKILALLFRIAEHPASLAIMQREKKTAARSNTSWLATGILVSGQTTPCVSYESRISLSFRRAGQCQNERVRDHACPRGVILSTVQ